MLKHRNVALVIFLSIITCGVYLIITMCKINNEVNRICEGDGKQPMHVIFAMLLGGVTLGIVPVIWFCKTINRLRDNAYRYGDVNVGHTAKAFALWFYLGAFIYVGPFIALGSFISSVNSYALYYGNTNPLPYTEDPNQREMLIAQAKQNGTYLMIHGVQPMQAQAMPVQPVVPVQPVAPTQAAPAQPVAPNPNVVVPPVPVAPVEVPAADATIPLDAYMQQPQAPLFGTINCVAGNVANASVQVQNGDVVSIGKDPSTCQITVVNTATMISRKHCSVVFDGARNSYTVIDESTNGTFLEDGTRLVKGEPKVVSRGTKIYLTNRETMFSLD